MKTICDFLQLFNQIINFQDYFTWILTILTTASFVYIITRFRKVKIQGVIYRKILYKNNGIEKFILSDDKIFMNGVEIECIIENPKEEILVQNARVEITDVKGLKYVNIINQVDFQQETQKLYFIEINNGSVASDKIQKYELRINHKSGKDKNDSIYVIRIEGSLLKSGEVSLLTTVDLSENKILKHFRKCGKGATYNCIELELVSDSNQILLTAEIPFNYHEKQFMIQGLGVGNTGVYDRKLAPIIELSDEQLCFDYAINLVLRKGINKCSFYLLANKACQINYTVTLMDINMKPITSIKNQEIKIQFPNYIITHFPNSNFGDLFYNNDNKIYTLEAIQSLKKECCNTLEINKNKLLDIDTNNIVLG